MRKLFLLLLLAKTSATLFSQDPGLVIPTLCQVPVAVNGVKQVLFSLNGDWQFMVSGKKTRSVIKVPGEWEMQGFGVSEGETATYSRTLDIPADWKGKKIIIRFDAVSSNAVVKVNGIQLASHEGSFVPFEADITSALNFNNDLLEVEVKSLTISDRIACTSQYACHTVGGILRKVTLFVLPESSIENTTAAVLFDKQYHNASLELNSKIHNPGNSPFRLQYTLTDAAGKPVMIKKVSATQGKFQIIKPQQWNAEHPYLYTLTTELIINGTVVQTNRQKIGFRQIEIRGNIFLVNGRPVKLHGVNRHAIYPLTGRSISADLDRKDAELFRAANCNYIRTSHYPPSEEFLNAADELGLYVESESSLCWIQHGASPVWNLWDYSDERFLPFLIGANIDNVLAGRNHPAVIIWSMGNESRWSPLWDKVLTAVKTLDPTRPASFHDQCWGGYNNAGSKADIANYHYPDIHGPAATDTMKRPTLFGEYAHLTTYNRRELLTDPGVRSSYNAPLVQFYDSIYAHPGNIGGAIWSGVDDIFHMPDGRIIGYGPWGPLDGWRRQKPEYYGIKKAYSPVKVKAIDWSQASKGYVELQVENRYDFTSFTDVAISVKINGEENKLFADLAPRTAGKIKIPVSPATAELYIYFTDPRGFIADEEYFSKQQLSEGATAITATSYLENEAAIFVHQNDVVYTISKQTGLITSVEKNEKTILKSGPAFAVVPMNNDNGGKPNVAGETYQNNIYPIKTYSNIVLFSRNINVEQSDEGIRVKADIAYNDSKGRQSYFFSRDGKFIFEYELTYTGTDSIPYQYGTLMQLPVNFDELGWKRKGEFSVYPANHIGRNEGTARLRAKRTTGIEEPGIVPSWDWRDDATEMGSNDFRSTKRNIYSAYLKNNEGNRVKLISNGQQSSRSWLQDEAVHWLIADYCNNGSEPFYTNPHRQDRLVIKNKILKGKMILAIE